MPAIGKRKRNADEAKKSQEDIEDSLQEAVDETMPARRVINFCLPTVCNVKVAKLRPKYDNLFEWMKDPKNAYIGRGGVVFINGTRFPGKSSIWANPFKIGRDGSRAVVIRKCEEHLRNLLKEKPELVNELMDLNGKNLGCWCVDSPTNECDDPEQIVCHGQLLIKLMKEFQNQ